MKNLGFATVIAGGLAAAVLGLAAPGSGRHRYGREHGQRDVRPADGADGHRPPRVAR